jgi:hypothetical protein
VRGGRRQEQSTPAAVSNSLTSRSLEQRNVDMTRASHAPLLTAAASAAFVFLAASACEAQMGPFADLAGAWSGAGQILTKDGEKERIRCRATYTIGGNGSGLNQVLSCASDSYRFDLKTTVTASGNAFSGNWSETSRNLNGTMNGRINGGKIAALVEANGFAGSLSVQTSGNRQTIAIRSENADLRGVDITLTR